MGFWSKSPKLSDEAMLVAFELKNEIAHLRKEFPASAYMFDATLRATSDVLAQFDPQKKVDMLRQSISQNGARTSSVDGGTSVLAQRFAVIVYSLSDQTEGVYLLTSTFGDAVHSGKSYRPLDERDELPPNDRKSQEILQSQGHKCFADFARSLRASQINVGYDDTKYDEMVQDTLAAFDVREEAASGMLGTRLRTLGEVIFRLELELKKSKCLLFR